MASPTQLSLKKWRALDYDAHIVEYWNPFAKKRKDLLGFADILCQTYGQPVVLLQVTSYSNMSARKNKILALDSALIWLSTGGRIVVEGWHKKPKKPGSKQLTWQARVVEIRLEDFSS